MFFIAPISLIPGISQFQVYFTSGSTPRLLLVTSSIGLFVEYFPFGAGAGTFGSAVAKMFYSPVYSKLGFEDFYGLNPDDGKFLNDSFWPIVLGQYGLFGLIICLFLLYFLLIPSLRRNSGEMIVIVANFLMVGSFLLSTLGSAIILSGLGIMYVTFFALIDNHSSANGLKRT